MCHILKKEKLLKKTIDSIENSGNNIKSGFKTCDIALLNANVVLNRIPDVDPIMDRSEDDVHWVKP